MIKKESRNIARKARHQRIRKKVIGTSLVPRLNVFRSNKQISASLIDDLQGETLVSISSLNKDLKIIKGNNLEAAKIVGQEIAKAAKKLKITEVVFDRGGYLYHGRIKALAEEARKNGLKF
ncbi:MAG: 50S ribosomal protein L18 [Bacilli bacterium]|jgi:large subunit ribosomal protein L18